MRNVISKNYKKLIVLFIAIASALVIAITAGFTLKPHAAGEVSYTLTKNDEKKINDSGPFNQYQIDFYLSLFTESYPNIDYNDYSYATVNISLDMKEKYKGYQQVFLYTTYATGYNEFLRRIEVQYGGDSLDKNYSTVTFKFKSLPLSDLRQQSPYGFIVRFGATGGGEDDWYLKNVHINVTLSSDIINSDNTAQGNVTYDYAYNNP